MSTRNSPLDPVDALAPNSFVARDKTRFYLWKKCPYLFYLFWGHDSWIHSRLHRVYLIFFKNSSLFNCSLCDVMVSRKTAIKRWPWHIVLWQNSRRWIRRNARGRGRGKRSIPAVIHNISVGITCWKAKRKFKVRSSAELFFTQSIVHCRSQLQDAFHWFHLDVYFFRQSIQATKLFRTWNYDIQDTMTIQRQS